MNDQISSEQKFKRNIAYKLRIGAVMSGQQIFEEERFRHLELGDRKVVRVNLIANITDKYVQEGEKKYASFTLDDGSGQIRLKMFSEDVDKFADFQQGDTVLAIGLLRVWNNELYMTPEILKKKDPAFLLVRKLEYEANEPKPMDKEKVAELKEKILAMVKDAEGDGGIDVDKLILELKEPPAVINGEIKKLLEDGAAYEPRPGKLRYLG